MTWQINILSAQKDSDAFSVYSFELTENMTFISGPFGETIQEEEESDPGVNGIEVKLPVKSSVRKAKAKSVSKPSTPVETERPRSGGKAKASVKNGKKTPPVNPPAKVRPTARLLITSAVIGCRL